MEDNLLTPQEPSDRRARVVNVHSYNETDLAEAIARQNIGISKPEALAMIEAMSEIQLGWIQSGNSINLRLAHFHPSIPGNFAEGEYPKEAVIRITASKEVAELAKKIPLRHVEPVSPIRIESVHDVKSDTVNSKVTSAGTVKIRGHNLRLAGIDPTVGAMFINVANQQTYPVQTQDIVTNNPSELILVAPALPVSGEVFFKITTQYSGNQKPLKKPRSITFEKILTVV
jgi:hypothetical protein